MLHVACLVFGRVGPPPTGALAPTWIYGDGGTTMPTDDVQKANWGSFGEACVNGRSQSPINICTKSVQQITNGSSSLQLHLQDEEMLPMNSGHNFELTVVDGQEKLYADVDGEKLQFVQVHWHAPSENTVDGSYAAMEAHFVHQGCARCPCSSSLSLHIKPHGRRRLYVDPLGLWGRADDPVGTSNVPSVPWSHIWHARSTLSRNIRTPRDPSASPPRTAALPVPHRPPAPHRPAPPTRPSVRVLPALRTRWQWSRCVTA